MLKNIIHTIYTIFIIVALSNNVFAQQGTSPVGVNWILVTFDQAPTTLTVNQAPLKYNKDFALSMQVDDGDLSLFTQGYPVFEGGDVNGISYPGMYYTDGCGNYYNFKMSSSVYLFGEGGLTGPDIHIDNAGGFLDWYQMNILYDHEWGILNHGVNSDENTDPSFIDYSIGRNRSYIRRKLFETTEGGVIPHVFVNPNGNPNWSTPAFNRGYIGALNQNIQFPLTEDGGDVNAAGVDWTQKYNLFRMLAEDQNMVSFVDNIANSSINGANYWSPVFTHSLINHYLFNDFAYDFNYIATAYGADGLDNILMTTDEEILNYLNVRDATNINYVINGTSLLITFSGEVPDDLLYYSSSIVINGDATINNIVVDGTDDYSFNGIGDSDALINVNWDGQIIIPDEYLADSMVTIASATFDRYDCWIAMDYVITLKNGTHKDSLRLILCEIPNIEYDEGFCSCEIELQPADTTINIGACIDLYGAVGDYTYEWFIDDSLVDITQDIYTCPVDTTTYIHIATNPLGCPAEDSILVNINFLSFDLGPDSTICEGSCVEISGPPDMEEYTWIVADTIFDTIQTIVPCPIDTTMYKLIVHDSLGASAEDSITLFVLPSPVFDLQPADTTISFGECVELFGAVGDYSWEWYTGDTLYDTNQNIIVCPLDTTQFYHFATNSYGCSGEDSITVNINFLSFDLGPDDTICQFDCLTLSGPPDMVIYNWIVADTLYDTIQEIDVCPMDTTKYTLWIENDIGATAVDSITILTLTAPTVMFESDSLKACYGDEVSLSVISSEDVDMFLWFYNGRDSITQTNNYNLVNVDDSANIYVGVVALNECTSVDSVYLSVLPYPDIITTSDTIVCPGDSLTLYVEGGLLFRWIVDGDTVSTDSSIVVTPQISTNYIAQTAYGDSLCFVGDTIKVMVYDSAHTKIQYDTNVVCTYELVELTAEGADHYLWLPGSDTTILYNITIIDTTTVYLTGTTSNGCESADSVIFYNKPAPDVSFTGLNSAYCVNDNPVELVGTPPDGTFLGPGIVLNMFNPESAGAGTHEIVYSYTNSEGCTGMDTIITTVYGSEGVIDLGDDFTLQVSESKTLDAGSGFSSYIWTTGEVTRTITVVGSDKLVGTYLYAVMGVISGCSTRGEVSISFEGPDGYSDEYISNLVIFPNPNNGNFNIKFGSVEKDISIGITNIQGKLVYSDNNISCDDDCNATIDLVGVGSGFYFLQITTPRGVRTAKIILK